MANFLLTLNQHLTEKSRPNFRKLKAHQENDDSGIVFNNSGPTDQNLEDCPIYEPLPSMTYFNFITKNEVAPDELEARFNPPGLNKETYSQFQNVYGNHVRVREHTRNKSVVDNMMAIELTKHGLSTLTNKKDIPIIFKAISHKFKTFGSEQKAKNM